MQTEQELPYDIFYKDNPMFNVQDRNVKALDESKEQING